MRRLFTKRYPVNTLEDIYRCPKCQGIVADGNSYCRTCGHKFSAEEIRGMRENVHSVVGAAPWNTRDRYRCVHCLEFICIHDDYCRGCGDEICDKEKQLMHANMKELARKNLPDVILCMGFVLFVIGGLMLINA